MNQRRKLSEDELKAIQGMAKVRLPTEMMATILGISKKTFERMLKTNDALVDALAKGRATGEGTFRNTLFAVATDPKSKHYGRMAEFFAKTQLGFKSADRIEISGPEGKPIEVRQMSAEERIAALKELNRKLKLTEDE